MFALDFFALFVSVMSLFCEYLCKYSERCLIHSQMFGGIPRSHVAFLIILNKTPKLLYVVVLMRTHKENLEKVFIQSFWSFWTLKRQKIVSTDHTHLVFLFHDVIYTLYFHIHVIYCLFSPAHGSARPINRLENLCSPVVVWLLGAFSPLQPNLDRFCVYCCFLYCVVILVTMETKEMRAN